MEHWIQYHTSRLHKNLILDLDNENTRQITFIDYRLIIEKYLDSKCILTFCTNATKDPLTDGINYGSAKNKYDTPYEVFSENIEPFQYIRFVENANFGIHSF